MAKAEKSQVEVLSRQELRGWLVEHHRQSMGVWLISHKKSSPHYLPYDVIVEEALCFGWIDSQPRSLDDARSQVYLSPRKAASAWSKANRERAEHLIAEGLMTPAGLIKIEHAKADGQWDFLVDVQSGVIPNDLATALQANPVAEQYFTAFPPSSKRIILEWIKMAKTAETRGKRIAETVAKAELNIRANHYR